MTEWVLESSAKVSCIGFLIFQGALLDVYLVILRGKIWALWSIADFVIICVWIATLAIAAKKFKQKKALEALDEADGRDPTDHPDEIKYAFVAWIVYAIFLIPRVAILFRKHAAVLDEKDVFGPNFLKVAVSCTPIIFLFLVLGHHDAKPNTERRSYINRLVGTVALDVFDSIDLLEFLFERDSQAEFPREYLDATLVFACINFLLPALALVEVRVNSFTGRVSSLSFKAVYTCSFLLVVNMPNLIIRSILWHRYDANVSVLIMKNVMCIIYGIIDMSEYFGKEQPIRCQRCKAWFQRGYVVKHVQACRSTSEKSPLHLTL